MDAEKYDINNENSNCELKDLIRVLKQKIRESHPKIKMIKRPKLLVAALRELDNMVGMTRLKNSIALQIMSLINDLNSGDKNMSMLNTILYGPPGVGKSRVGIILSKIWYGLGFLREPATRQEFNMEGIDGNYDSLSLFVLLFVFFVGIYGAGIVGFVYNNYSMYWVLILIAAVAILLFGLYRFAANTKLKKNISARENDEPEDNIISVVSRQDFVAGFVGQTATKTKALLTKNLGKVVFIDEAYSLLNDNRDSFGHEALTTLNLFLSEHPNEIVVIFAGYEDKLKNGIFKAQPGLQRRCMWHFECEGYNSAELCEIFSRQVTRDGWKLSSETDIYDIIKRNKDIFHSYGGDTERLLFFSKLQAAKSNFLGKKESERTLYPADIESGIVQLLQNNISSNDIPKDDTKSYKTNDLFKTLLDRMNTEQSLSNSC